ncbi:MAG: CPBP family intramembrane metalloprotease [Bacteroidales bacterium]|nr:CPBP family intramembrane metalloprotease [Bacteroidales bacterium]
MKSGKIVFEKKDIPVYVLLLSAPVLLTLYRYHGYPQYFYDYFPSAKTLVNGDILARYWQFAVFFVLMFILPALYIKFGLKKSLYDFGWGLGDVKYGAKWLITIPFVVVPIIYLSSKMPDVRAEYPLAKSFLTNQHGLFTYELAYILLYYVAWEFFFRGFLLFGLRKRFGDINAILIQTISSCLVHIDKPEGEIIGSIFVGILFGIIALRSRSIWYVFLIHISIGVLTDLFIIYFR